MSRQSPLILLPLRNPTLRIIPPKGWRKVEKKILKLVLLKPLYRRKNWIKSVTEFWSYTTLIRTSAAAFISERRGLNIHRISLYATSAAAFIPVVFSATALIFCNFSFMSVAALNSIVPNAAAFKLLSAFFRLFSLFLHFSHLRFHSSSNNLQK